MIRRPAVSMVKTGFPVMIIKLTVKKSFFANNLTSKNARESTRWENMIML